MNSKMVNVLFLVFSAVVLATVVFPPIFKHINKIEPFILGLPFVQFWIILVVITLSLTLVAWYFVENKRGEL